MSTLLRGHAAAMPDKPALIDDAGTTTWAEVDDRVDRAIHALRSLGAVNDDRIALLSGNRREVYEVQAAVSQNALVLVPVNWHLAAEEVAYIVRDSGATVLVVDVRYADLAEAALAHPEMGDAPKPAVVVLDPDGAPNRPDGWLSYEELLTKAPGVEPDGQTLGSVMFYTSGTTGRPKGVRSSKVGGSLEPVGPTAAGFCGLMRYPAGGPDTHAATLLCGPHYHSAQWAWSAYPFLAGSTIVILHGGDAGAILAAIDEHRITNLHVVPTQLVRMLGLPQDLRERFSGASLQSIWHGAAPCAPDVKRAALAWFGPIVHEYYGATEGGIITLHYGDVWHEHPDAVGKILPTQECIVVDDEGTKLGVGETGRLYFKSKAGHDFAYHGEPEKTAGAHLEPGVYTFGDVGHVDEEGYLHLTDRAIDMIISGGVNIYPAEIEAVIQAHPAVADVAVIGIPHPEFGESVKACLELLPGHADDDELRASISALCRERLAGYKVPRSYAVLDALPRSAAGKLQKRFLREAEAAAT